jgi:cytochrome P450
MSSLPPGPRRHPLLQTFAYGRSPTGFLDRCRARYGDMFTVRLTARAAAQAPGEATWVFLAHPDHVKQVFTGDPGVFRAGEANQANLPMRLVVGPRSILMLDERAHMTERKLLLPALHRERIESYGDVMSEVARAEVERWPVGEPFALWPHMQAITLEVIVRTVFGVTLGEQVRRMRYVLARMLNAGTSARHLALLALLGPRRSERLSGGLIAPVEQAVLDEIRCRRGAAHLEGREDILSLLMRGRYEDGSAPSDAELRDELMTLLIAGHESTATELAWAFERLLRHPEKLARLREEAIDGGDAYEDAVVKETLRLRPVLPFVLRRLAAPAEIGGHLLPTGTSVAPCIYLVHRRADIYPEPLRFRPERFLDQPPGTYTWFPFGGGVRRCLGTYFAQLEMKRVLQAVVTSSDLAPARHGSERLGRRFITIAPSRGARAVMRRRLSVPAPKRSADVP